MKFISTRPLWSLIVLFQLGSNVVFGFGSQARQDAWIAALISAGLGGGLILLYSILMKWFPGYDWINLLRLLLGKVGGSMLGFIYILAFIYVAGRVLRDFGELFQTYILPRTPMPLTMSVFLLLCGYAVFAGLERISRLAELCINIVLLYIIGLTILLLLTDVAQIYWLYPLATDWKRILAAVYPLGVNVPYGETLVFALLWSMMKPAQFRKASLWAVATTGAMFILLDLLAITVLSPEVFAAAIFPILTMFQIISVADFLENVDPLVVTIFMIGGMFKIIVFFYASCQGISSFWRIKSHRTVLLPVGLLVWLIAVYTADNIASHLLVGLQWVPWLLWTPLFMLIPLMLLPVAWWKKKRGEMNGESLTDTNAG